MSARRTAITVSLLIAYLLAVTVGGRFHTHGTSHCGRSGHGYALPHEEALSSPCSCPHACGGHHGHGPEPWGKQAPPKHGSSDSCPVCRFLAQKPAPVERVEEVTSAPLAERIEPPAPERYLSEAPSVYRCRAPPRDA